MDTKLFFLFALCALPLKALEPISGAEDVPDQTSFPKIQNCSSEDSTLLAQKECFTRERLDVKLHNSGSGSETKQNVFDAILTNNFQNLCSDISSYQRATVCAMKTPVQCLTSDYQYFFPSAANIRKVLAMWCDNPIVGGISCIKSVESRLQKCGENKGITYGRDKDWTFAEKDLLCFASLANAECQLEVIPTCGCRLTKLRVEMAKHLNPPACSPIPVKIPECKHGTDEFVNRGAILLQRMSLLAVCALLCASYTAV